MLSLQQILVQVVINFLKHRASELIGDQNIQLVANELGADDANGLFRKVGQWLDGPEGRQEVVKAIGRASKYFADSDADSRVKQMLAASQLPLDSEAALQEALAQFQAHGDEDSIRSTLETVFRRDVPGLDAQTAAKNAQIYVHYLSRSLVALNAASAPKAVGLAVLRIENHLREVEDRLGTIGSRLASTESARIEISDEQRQLLLQRYLARIGKTTGVLPWGYLPASIPIDLNIGDIYVQPYFEAHKRTWNYAQDEWSERAEQDDIATETKPKRGAKLKRSHEQLRLGQVLESGQSTAIIGFMGTGKSMAANYLTWALASGEGQRELGVMGQLNPVLIKLGRFLLDGTAQLHEGGLLSRTFSLAAADFGGDGEGYLAQILRDEWGQGKVLVTFDALDEFPGSQMPWISGELARIAADIPRGSKIVLTSRPNAFGSARLISYRSYDLRELEPDGISSYVRGWVKALCRTEEFSSIDPARHSGDLLSEISLSGLIRQVASNPLFLTILIVLSLSSSIQGQPASIKSLRTASQLLSAYVDWIIEWEKRKGRFVPQRYAARLLRVTFAYAAYHLQQGHRAHRVVSRSAILDKLSISDYFTSRHEGDKAAEDCLNFWIETGILTEQEDGVRSLGFRHQAFQLFGAALALTYQPPGVQAQGIRDAPDDSETADIRAFYFGLKNDDASHQ